MEEKIIKFLKWIEEHPMKRMFFVEIPISVITSLITVKLLGW